VSSSTYLLTSSTIHTAVPATSLSHKACLFSLQLKNSRLMESSDTAAAKDDDPTVKPRRTPTISKKKAAAERIGISGGRRRR
jgi:hypothetical protein